MVRIEESKMIFGDFPKGAVFHIEKSCQYSKLMPNGIKSCEFILLRNDVIYFIEAKESCPNQIKADTPEEKKEKYREFMDEITDKMRHSLLLYGNILLNRYDSEGVPLELCDSDLSARRMCLVLVVKNAEKEWLVPWEDKLRSTLSKECRIWKCDPIFVINEEKAREKHFVL